MKSNSVMTSRRELHIVIINKCCTNPEL